MKNIKVNYTAQLPEEAFEPNPNAVDYSKGVEQGKPFGMFSSQHFKAKAGAKATVTPESAGVCINLGSSTRMSRQSLREFILFLIRIDKEY